jgi:hypothetical protein
VAANSNAGNNRLPGHFPVDKYLSMGIVNTGSSLAKTFLRQRTNDGQNGTAGIYPEHLVVLAHVESFE